jgi:hypothetical protein
MRKLLLFTLAFCVASAAAVPLMAADTPESAAEKASTSWLALVDAGKYAESWREAAELFRQAVPQTQWPGMVEKARSPFGKLVTRKLKSAKLTHELPGAPAGDYVVIQYDTDFEKKTGATETVTPMKDKDGVWRVSGYFVKP